MSIPIAYVLPALLVSAAALVALHIARSAPPAMRLILALIGMSAWLVPWPLLNLPAVSFGGLPVGEWTSAGSARWLPLLEAVPRTIEAAVPVAGRRWFWLATALLPGLVWFVVELISYRVTVDRWRIASRSGQALERLLPAAIRADAPSIRLVADSSIAVATGCARSAGSGDWIRSAGWSRWAEPTIWIGDRIVDSEERRIALTHEASHLRRGDPAWLLVIGLIARVFWFNPFVYALRRHAILAIETGCDEACAHLLGRQQYRNTLAQLVLHGQKHRRIALAPMLHSTSVDLLRLSLLETRPRMDGRAWAAVSLLLFACAGGAELSAQTTQDSVSGVAIESTDGSRNLSPTRYADASRYGYDVPPIWGINQEQSNEE